MNRNVTGNSIQHMLGTGVCISEILQYSYVSIRTDLQESYYDSSSTSTSTPVLIKIQCKLFSMAMQGTTWTRNKITFLVKEAFKGIPFF